MFASLPAQRMVGTSCLLFQSRVFMYYLEAGSGRPTATPRVTTSTTSKKRIIPPGSNWQLTSLNRLLTDIDTVYWNMAEGLESERLGFNEIGIEIGDTLLRYYVELIRLSLLGEEILPENEPEKEAEIESFYKMFERLLKKTASPFETASIIYSVLKECCCNDANVSKLESYVESDFDLRQSYPNIVLKLRIAGFLRNLGKENCVLAMMVYSHLHLDNMAIDKCSPLQYIRLLFQREVAERDKLEELAGWFNKKGYFKDLPEGI